MTLTVVTPPQQTSLVDLAQLRQELLPATLDDPTALAVARQATAVIETYCGRPFGRGAYTETIPGFGSTTLMLARTPIAQVTAVTMDSSPVVDYSIDDAEAGFLYRELGWQWSVGSRFILSLSRLPGAESRPFGVTYVAGYLLPDDDVGDATVSVAAVDRSFNRAAGTFPLLVPGDQIVSSEFTTAANNGTWTVVTRTATKITVAEAGLVNEAAGAVDANPRTLRVRTLPEDVARAAVDVAKARYFARTRDPMVSSRSITGLSISYATGTQGPLAVPPAAAALLTPWRRAA